MDGLIDQRAAALGFPSAAPAAFHIIGRFAMPGNKAAAALESAIFTGSNDPFSFPHIQIIPILEANAQRHQRSGLLQQCPLLPADYRRLFRKDGNALLRGHQGHGRMQIMRGAKMHHIHRFFFQQFFHGGIGITAIFFRHGVRPFLANIGAGDQLNLGEFGQRCGVHLGNSAAADNANTIHRNASFQN